MATFLLTVLPSQKMGCYAGKFPPPPADWWEWCKVGAAPRNAGGCNDLTISGHATVIAVFMLAITDILEHRLLAGVIWAVMAIDFGFEVLEKWHYSVDMFLGTVFSVLIWDRRVYQPPIPAASASAAAAVVERQR